jgi:hypothetical protein
MPTLICILAYSASVILSNIAHGWSDDSAQAHPSQPSNLKPVPIAPYRG